MNKDDEFWAGLRLYCYRDNIPWLKDVMKENGVVFADEFGPFAIGGQE